MQIALDVGNWVTFRFWLFIASTLGLLNVTADTKIKAARSNVLDLVIVCNMGLSLEVDNSIIYKPDLSTNWRCNLVN
ncbi:hypothetical protein [Nostoc sp.]|uniref:hypothetical protein n=1 Tax=Nostoc sp. TaxID=1180 RepID=UPI002FFC0ECE